ncbi:hypothetical protein BV508_18340, partial [Mycobacterium intermedium]
GRLIKVIPPSLLVLLLVTAVLPLVQHWLQDIRIGPVWINRTVATPPYAPPAPTINCTKRAWKSAAATLAA